MKLFKSLFHVTLRVNDIEKTMDFYEKLGFEKIFTMSNEGKDWNYYLKIGQCQYLELQPVASTNPNPHPDKTQYYWDQTVWHYALETPDMDNMVTTLLERGIPLYHDPVGINKVTKPSDVGLGPDGCRICWTIDPDGTPIELMDQSAGETLQKKYDPESYL